MISFERSEKEIKEKKEQAFRHLTPILPHSLPIATAKLFTVSRNNRINSNSQKGKLSFVRTLVRVL